MTKMPICLGFSWLEATTQTAGIDGAGRDGVAAGIFAQEADALEQVG
jgi:hypothetical protein